jgi:hypothetical protein
MKSCLAIETSNTNSCIKCYTFNQIFIFSGGHGRGIFAYKNFMDRGCTWQGENILKFTDLPIYRFAHKYLFNLYLAMLGFQLIAGVLR